MTWEWWLVLIAGLIAIVYVAEWYLDRWSERPYTDDDERLTELDIEQRIREGKMP